MIFEVDTPANCDECIFCDDNYYCMLTGHRKRSWKEIRQEDCPFDCGGKTIAWNGVRAAARQETERQEGETDGNA